MVVQWPPMWSSRLCFGTAELDLSATGDGHLTSRFTTLGQRAEKMVEIDGHLPFKHQAIGDLTNEQMNKWFGCKEDNQPQKNAV